MACGRLPIHSLAHDGDGQAARFGQIRARPELRTGMSGMALRSPMTSHEKYTECWEVTMVEQRPDRLFKVSSHHDGGCAERHSVIDQNAAPSLDARNHIQFDVAAVH